MCSLCTSRNIQLKNLSLKEIQENELAHGGGFFKINLWLFHNSHYITSIPCGHRDSLFVEGQKQKVGKERLLNEILILLNNPELWIHRNGNKSLPSGEGDMYKKKLLVNIREIFLPLGLKEIYFHCL